MYQQKAEQNEQTEFSIIVGAGHCPHNENPTEVNIKILQWLDKINLDSANTNES